MSMAGLLGVCVGIYATLDATTPRLLGLPMLCGGALVAGTGLYVSGRHLRRSVYRPDRWRLPEFAVAGCGIGAAVVLFATAGIDLYPSLDPLAWPTLSVLPLAGVLLAGLPAFLAPPPSRTASPPRVPVQAAKARDHASEAVR
jgi:energy-coupling factor transport system permease protein